MLHVILTTLKLALLIDPLQNETAIINDIQSLTSEL